MVAIGDGAGRAGPAAERQSRRRALGRQEPRRASGQSRADTVRRLVEAGGQKDRAAGNVLSKPLYWAGKLFFRAPDGDYVCSAQFISPNVILTAAHCVRDPETGNWYEDFIFALQYNAGKYGAVYSYDCVATRNAWVQPGFEKFLADYAMIRVDKPSRTGNFGTHWGWRGNYNDATKIGYPGGVSDGEIIQVEHGPIAFVDGVVQIKHGNTADQGGSSGGAWIGQFSDQSRATTTATTSSASSPSATTRSRASTTARTSTRTSRTSGTTSRTAANRPTRPRFRHGGAPAGLVRPFCFGKAGSLVAAALPAVACAGRHCR